MRRRTFEVRRCSFLGIITRVEKNVGMPRDMSTFLKLFSPFTI